ncbi:hypothetical protein CDD82_2249 [Ophiocordyceps australis]|uniref:Polynucleotide 5'-hydroxyl-kinase GRC3 n=1 Tax=Ophiocordyceps australis TaxID=1399860 RepID=A0A2C5ZHZ6_9HYPO|nr:hypothetical protein CDD82_2249 [Ophiocordyceps australis]
MSSTLPPKRRKLEASRASQSAVSAVAARRRLAEAGPSSPGEATPSASSNPFSLLQTLQTPYRDSLREQTVAKQTSSATVETGNTTAQTPLVTYSSFTLTKENHRVQADGTLEISLKDCERFILVGSYGIQVLRGSVSVAGAVITPGFTTNWVHAPYCCAVPVLRTAEDTKLMLYHDVNAHGLRNLGRLSPIFRRIWDCRLAAASPDKPNCPSTFEFIGNSGEHAAQCTLQELVSPPQWNQKLVSLAESLLVKEPATALICGPKSAGKSTFSRLLTNRLLTCANSDEPGNQLAHGVAVLDIDPGQPEYSPPGTLSLVHVTKPNLGAPFTHPSLDDEGFKIVRCHALATVNPASSTDLYAECTMDLYSCYRQTLRNCPLLINTSGWVLGLGLELLLEVIGKIGPAEVVYMSTEGPLETVEALRNATKRCFTTLPSQPSQIRSRTATQLRDMQTMSYFHSFKKQDPDGTSRLAWQSWALSSMRPLVVRYTGKNSGILGILRYDFQLPANLIAEAINGMVLAIVEIEDARAFRSLAPANSYKLGHAGDAATLPSVLTCGKDIPLISNPNDETLDPRYSHTLGLGLVRGVDEPNQSLHILTPVPLPRLVDAKGIVLVHGNLDTPTWCYTEHLYEQEEAEPEYELDGMTDEGDQDMATDNASLQTAVPWVEVLKGAEKRPVGSKVWRVRRDLGR